MQDGPSSSEMLTAIISLLTDRIAPKIDGHDAYALRVAINSLGTVKRECDDRAAYEASEHSRLIEILGHDGQLSDLNAELCEKIRNGDFTLGNKSVLKHLKQTAIDQVRIDQPKYSGLAYALEQSSKCPPKTPPAQ